MSRLCKTPRMRATFSIMEAKHSQRSERRIAMDTCDSTRKQTPPDVTHQLEPTTGSKAPEMTTGHRLAM